MTPVQIIQHNAVLACTPHQATFKAVLQWAFNRRKELPAGYHHAPLFVSGKSAVGGIHTIILLPDGNLEGHPGSDTFDQFRADFIARLAEDTYGDGSPLWQWIEIGWGDYGPHVIDSNTKNAEDGFVPEGQRRRRR